jgi:PAS domain S-box-containing protein
MTIRRTSVAVVAVVALVTVTTAVMAVLAGLNYVSYRDRARERLRQDLVVQADQLAVALALPVWNIDRAQIDRVLDALERDREIAAVEVVAAGKTHARRRDEDGRMAPADGAPSEAGLLEEHRPITLARERIGTLNLYATPRFLEQDRRRTLTSIVTSILAVDLLLVLSVYLVLWRVVLKPLMDVERYARAVTAGETVPPPTDHAQGFARELDNLRSSIESMVGLLGRRYEELRASEKKYRDIVHFSPIGIYQALPDGTLLTANESLARILGCERVEDALSLNARDIYWDAEERARLIERYAGVGYAARLEVRLRRRDGTPFWVEMTAHAIKDASGQPVYFETLVQDISARKSAEDALRTSEERYRLLFEGNPVPMLVYDLETMRFIDANRSAVEQYGYSREDLFGLGVPDVALPGDPNLDEFVQTRFEPRPSVVHVGRRQQRRRDGTIFDMDLTTLALLFDGRPARVMLARDLTGELQAQAEQQRLQESLRRSETMAAMGILLAGVAHEVRNPLFSISATVDAVESEFGSRLDFAEYGELLRTQVARLTQLMRDLLDYGRPAALSLTAVHPAEPARRAARACAGLARRQGVEVKEEVDPLLPPLALDAARMEQVFENLLANAIQHSPREGRVRLVAHLTDGGPRPVVAFEIEDEGPGIAAADLSRVFEPFFSRRKGGTGLGLPIVQRIVEAHGGEVWAANRPQGGAVFTVTMPVPAADAAAGEAVLPAASGPDGRTMRRGSR